MPDSVNANAILDKGVRAPVKYADGSTAEKTSSEIQFVESMNAICFQAKEPIRKEYYCCISYWTNEKTVKWANNIVGDDE